MSELRDVAPPGLDEGGFGGSHQGRHCEIVEMVLSFSAVYAAVATVTRFRALLMIVRNRILYGSDSRAHNLLNY